MPAPHGNCRTNIRLDHLRAAEQVTIRCYASEGLISAAVRRHGRRVYLQRDVEVIRLVLSCKLTDMDEEMAERALRIAPVDVNALKA